MNTAADASAGTSPDLGGRLVAALTERGWRIGVAESLTGGLLVARLIDTPGASAVVTGAVVAYDTAVKHSLLGVDAALLDREGPVHPEVARQLAHGARRALAVDGRPADLGLATTGVAGPDWQGGRPPGTVYVGLSFADGRDDEAIELALDGDRAEIRRASVQAAIEFALKRLGEG